MLDRDFWMRIREALLGIVDAIESDPDIYTGPRTSELRKQAKKRRPRKPEVGTGGIHKQ
jgi:hypothetical protein